MWPFSHALSASYYFTNRRLFNVIEPFMCNSVVKLSASVPIEWKLNRRLYHNVCKPYLHKTRWIRHPNGRYPYLSTWPNLLPRTATIVTRKFYRKLNVQLVNQGSWPDGHFVEVSRQEHICKIENQIQSEIASSKILSTIKYADLAEDQRLRVLQVIEKLQAH